MQTPSRLAEMLTLATELTSRKLRPRTCRIWVRRAQQELKVCVLSNSSKRTRVRKLAEMLDAPCVWPAGKPWPIAYRRALALTGTQPGETVMIGDQLLTDILGANLHGLRTILVQPLGTNEFIGTKFTRLIEGLVIALLKRRGLLPAESPIPPT